jgi:hypothetical protein
MNGTADMIATAATIFERVRPAPPKRDFTPALKGEFKDIYGSPYLHLMIKGVIRGD